jgi:hypothetical protein
VPQELYWPEGHEKAGLFKGMARILTERGFDVSKLKAQCKTSSVQLEQWIEAKII